MCETAKNKYKQITPENWTEPDPTNECFIRFQPDGTARAIKGEEYLTDILCHNLGDHVCEDIHRLFEVAKGTMTYGYYYYPIFTAAAEQLFRILESSVSHVCKIVDCPTSIRTYYSKIDWLTQQGIIGNDEKDRWDSSRQLRNSRSHPEHQMILTPGSTIGLLSSITDEINSLFIKMNEYLERKTLNTEQVASAVPGEATGQQS